MNKLAIGWLIKIHHPQKKENDTHVAISSPPNSSPNDCPHLYVYPMLAMHASLGYHGVNIQMWTTPGFPPSNNDLIDFPHLCQSYGMVRWYMVYIYMILFRLREILYTSIYKMIHVTFIRSRLA